MEVNWEMTLAVVAMGLQGLATATRREKVISWSEMDGTVKGNVFALTLKYGK